jgi:hypothetical protein
MRNVARHGEWTAINGDTDAERFYGKVQAAMHEATLGFFKVTDQLVKEINKMRG